MGALQTPGNTLSGFAALVPSYLTGTGGLFDRKRLFLTKRRNTDLDKCRFVEIQKGALLKDKLYAFWKATPLPFVLRKAC